MWIRMTEQRSNLAKYFKPINFVWLFSVMLLIAVYFYGDKNLDFSQTNSNVKEIHYADAITPTHLNLINKFNEKYEGRIKVVPIDLPFTKFSTNERKELLARALRSKSEKIDIFAVDIVWGYRFAKWAENLTPHFSQDLLDKIIEPIFPTCYFNDSLIAFPHTIDQGTLYYREDILKTLPDSETILSKVQESISWEDLIALGLRLKKEYPNFYLFPASDYEGLICSFSELLLNLDRDYFQNKTIDLTKPEAVKALKTLQNFIHTYQITPEDVTGFTEFPCHEFYLANDGVFLRSWPTFISEHFNIYGNLDPEVIKRAPLPHFKGTKPASIFGGWNLMVSKFSNNKPEVIEFIKFLLQHESQKELFEGNGSLPVLKSVYNDPTVENSNVLKFYKSQFEFGVHRPLLEDYTRISDIISYFVHHTLTGEISAETALTQATKMINSNEVIFK